MQHRRTTIRLTLATTALVAAGLLGPALAGGGTSIGPVDACHHGYGHGKWTLPGGNHGGEFHGVLVEMPGQDQAFIFSGKLGLDPTLSPIKPESGTLHGTLTPVPDSPLASVSKPKFFVKGTWSLTDGVATGAGAFKASIQGIPSVLAPGATKPAGKMHGVFHDPGKNLLTAFDPGGVFKCKWSICKH